MFACPPAPGCGDRESCRPIPETCSCSRRHAPTNRSFLVCYRTDSSHRCAQGRAVGMHAKEISVSEETIIYPVPDAVMKAAHVSGMPAYQKLVAEADADHSAYWARLAREFVSWKTPFTKSLDEGDAPFFKWFEDGTLNASYNCLDRHVESGRG